MFSVVQGCTGHLAHREISCWAATSGGHFFWHRPSFHLHRHRHFYPTSVDCINRYVQTAAIYTTVPDCTSLLWLVLSGNLILIYLYFALGYRHVPKLFYYKLRKKQYIGLNHHLFNLVVFFPKVTKKGKNLLKLANLKSVWQKALLAPCCVDSLEMCINNSERGWKCLAHWLAQWVERASHVQRLCPRCSRPEFESRPGALCCVSLLLSLILSPLQLFYQYNKYYKMT